MNPARRQLQTCNGHPSMERPPRRRIECGLTPAKAIALQHRSNAALDNMSVNRLRLARLWARWALWWSNNHPQALTTAAMVWLASGRYAKALRFAERAHHRLNQGTGEVDHAALNRLTSEIYAAGAMASCHLRNDAKEPTKRDLMGCEAHHWFQLLAKHDAEAFHVLLDEPVLRDLRPVVKTHLDSKETPW